MRTGNQILMKFDIWKGLVLQSSYFKSRPDPMTLRGIREGNRNSWKRKNWGIFILRMSDRILIKLDIKEDLMSQMLYFLFEWIRGHRGWRGGNRNLGNQKSRKTLRVERSGWNLKARINTSFRYVIYIIGPDSLSLGELRGISSALASSVLLDVLGRWKLVSVSGTYANWLDNSPFPDSTMGWR